MAKRLTDTEKWKKAFLRGLDAPCKLLWLYICDDCDHAGIWNVDFDVAEIRIGEKINQANVINSLSKKIVVFDDGKKWYIPSFVEFQYPAGLNSANKVHASILQILQKYNLINSNSKPLASPLEGAKDIDKDTDKVKDKEPTEEFQNWDDEKRKFTEDGAWQIRFSASKQVSYDDLTILMNYFVGDLELKSDYKPFREIQKHFTNWFNKTKPSAAEISKLKSDGRTEYQPTARERKDEALLREIENGR